MNEAHNHNQSQSHGQGHIRPPQEILRFFQKCSVSGSSSHLGTWELSLVEISPPRWPIFGSSLSMIVLGGMDFRCYFKALYNNSSVEAFVAHKHRSLGSSSSACTSPREFMREFTNLVAGHAKNELASMGVRVGISTPVTSPSIDEVFFNHRKSKSSAGMVSYWEVSSPQGKFTCALAVDFVADGLLPLFAQANPLFQQHLSDEEFLGETEAAPLSQQESMQLELNRAVQSIGSVLGIQEAMRDITEEFIDQIPDALMLCDADGFILKLNPAAAKLLNCSLEEALLKNLSALVDTACFEALLAMLETSRKGKIVEGTVTLEPLQKKAPVANPSPETPSSETLKRVIDWRIWTLDKSSERRIDIICLYGRDVTLLLQHTADKVRLDGELEQARILQDSVAKEPPAVPEASVVSFYQPASHTGGDWISCQVSACKTLLRICVGDVTGHGFACSLLTTAVHGTQVAFNSLESLFRKESFSSPILSEESRIRKLVPAINSTVCEVGNREKFLTLCLFSVDLKTGDYVYASLGHPPVFLYSAETKSTRKLRLAGSRLGRTNEVSFKTQIGKLMSGDRVFLYTDGLFENQSLSGNLVTEKSVIDALSNSKDGPIFATILKDLMKQAWHDSEIEDDVSYLFLDFHP